MRTALYPLKFTPRFVEKMWGGRKLQTVLHKPLPPGRPIGESWELYDFPPGVVDNSGEWVSSVISNGPLAGQTLHQAMAELGGDLLGSAKPAGAHRQFPLLVKFLDAREDLSVQVHPDQAYADAHPEAHLKSEAWYVMQHDPGARLFKGLRPGTAPKPFSDAIAAGTVERCLTTLPARRGDCHYLPSGTVHALGAGMLVAEVQTPSDTTFRVYDFNRIDPATAKPRALHVEQAMQCIRFDEPEPAPRPGAGREADMLVASPYFAIERLAFPAGAAPSIAGGEPVVLIVLEGNAQAQSPALPEPLRLQPGDTLLLPAALAPTPLQSLTAFSFLKVTLPR